MPTEISSDKGSVDASIDEKVGKYTISEIEALAAQFEKDGFVVLKNHFCPEKLEEWRRAFVPILEARIKDGTASARGPQRYYVSLPFSEPFADPEIFEDPDCLAILSRVGGDDLVMPELASDTPFKGSEYQVIHRDVPQRSTTMPELDPKASFQFGVNFPLSRVTRENGPFEIAKGTHDLTDEETKEMIKSGAAEKAMEPLLMDVGDIMIRDVRALHRGTPNNTEDPRIMVVIGYNRRHHPRPQLRIHIPSERYEQLSDQGKRMLDVNPRVDKLAEVQLEELYSNLYFLDEEKK